MITEVTIQPPQAEASAERADRAQAPEREGEPKLAELALWLTEAEAQALVCLCAASTGDGGEVERTLFGKLGCYLRSFRLEQSPS